MMNGLKTAGLFAAMIAIFMLLGYLIGTAFWGGPGGWYAMTIFFAMALAINLVSYFYSDKLVLRTYRVKLVSRREAPRLYKVVGNLCVKTGMAMPKIGIIPSKTPNAFATGRKEAVICATRGLIDLMDAEELEGVLAHELAHIRDKDMFLMTLAATIAGAIAFAARTVWWSMLFGGSRRGNQNIILVIIAAVTAPIAALLIRLAISRSREYKADTQAALTTQKPRALANALQKLRYYNDKRPIEKASPTTSNLFIVAPFASKDIFTRMFSTHPPIEARVKNLKMVADDKGFPW